MISWAKVLPALSLSSNESIQEPLRYQEVITVVQRQVHEKVRSSELEKILSELYPRFWNQAGAREDDFKENIAEFIRNCSSDVSCQRNPLPRSIKGPGQDIDTLDLSRVLYMHEPNPQRNGWTCGYRAVCYIAAITKIIKDGLPLTHEKVTTLARDFFESDEKFSTFLTHIFDQKKIAAVLALLKTDVNKIEEVKEYIDTDPHRALLKLQEDFFIIEGSLQFLARRTPIAHTLSLLGRARTAPIKKAGDELLEKILEKVRLTKGEELVALEQEVMALSSRMPREIARVLSEATGAIEKENNLQERQKKSQDRQRKIVSILLGSCDLSMRKWLRIYCRENAELRTEVNRLRAGVVALVNNVPITQNDCAELQRKLQEATPEKIQAALKVLCSRGRLREVLNALAGPCPDLTAALALFESDDEVWEIIDRINAAEFDEKPGVMKKFERDLRRHEVFQELLSKVNDEKQATSAGNFDDVISKLQKMKDDADAEKIETICNDLRRKEKEDIENLRSFFTKKLNEMDHEQAAEILSTIFPRIVQDGEGRDDLGQQAMALLDESITEETKLLIEMLEAEQPDLTAICEILDKSEQPTSIVVKIILEVSLKNLKTTVSALEQEKPLRHRVLRELRHLESGTPKEHTYPGEADLSSLFNLTSLKLDPSTIAFVGGILLGVSNDPFFRETEYTRPDMAKADLDKLSAGQISAIIGNDIRRDFIRKCLRTTAPVAYHFLCATRLSGECEHWIAISLIRYKGPLPVLVVLDSMNKPVRGSRDYSLEGDSMIHFLFNSILR